MSSSSVVDLNNVSVTATDANSMRLLNPMSVASSTTSEDVLATTNTSQLQIEPPSNLLVIFLQSCSAILQDTKMDNNTLYDTTKV